MLLAEETRTAPLLKVSTVHTCHFKKKIRFFDEGGGGGETFKLQELRIYLPYQSCFRLDKIPLVNWEQPARNYKAKSNI